MATKGATQLYKERHDKLILDDFVGAQGGICTVTDAAGNVIATIDPKSRVRTEVRA